MTEKCACSILRLMAIATMLVGACLVTATLVGVFSETFRALGDALFAVVLGYSMVIGVGLALFVVSPRLARLVVA